MNKKFIVSLMTSVMLAGPLVHLTVVDASQNSEESMSQEEKSFKKEKAELEEDIMHAQATIDALVIDISKQEADTETVEEDIVQIQKEIAELKEQMKQRNDKLVTKARSNKSEVKVSANPLGRMKGENNSAPSDQYIKLAQLGDQKILDKAKEQVKRQEEELESVKAELKVSRDDMVSQRSDIEDRIVQIVEKHDLSDDERESFINEQTIIAERTSNLNEEQKAEKQRILEEEREKEEAERLAKEKAEAEAEEKEKAEKEEKEAKEKAKAKEKKEAEEKAKVEVKGEVSTSSSDDAKESQSSGWTRPANGNLTSPFGYRTHPVTGKQGSFHAGIDIAGSGSVVASRAGTVTQASYSDTYGYTVIVDHGDGYSTLYAHLKKGLSVSNGQSVSQGQQLGIMGTTGRSTGIHLHFEVRKGGEAVDPMNYLN